MSHICWLHEKSDMTSLDIVGAIWERSPGGTCQTLGLGTYYIFHQVTTNHRGTSQILTEIGSLPLGPDCKIWHFWQYLVGVRYPVGANWCKCSCNPGVSGAKLVLVVHGRVVDKSCHNQKPPLFLPTGVKSASQVCSPTFFFEALLWWFSLCFGAIFPQWY